MTELESWRDFNTTMVGATAALVGLVIVAASVNIKAVLKTTSLTSRLAAAIVVLMTALSASAIALFPKLTTVEFGVAIIVAALVSAAFQVAAARRVLQNRVTSRKLRVLNVVVGLLPIVAYLVGGGLMALSRPDGLAVVAVGTLSAIISAVVVSWIVLVEVLR